MYASLIHLLDLGDQSAADSEHYADVLHRFRTAVCRAVDNQLADPDQLYVQGEQAFAVSADLPRLGNFLYDVQKDLWRQELYVKGLLSAGHFPHAAYAALPEQSPACVAHRTALLHGAWFGPEALTQAYQVKTFYGTGIALANSVRDEPWLADKQVLSGFLAEADPKRWTPTAMLKLPGRVQGAATGFVRHYEHTAATAPVASRQLVPLLTSWVQSLDYTDLDTNGAGAGHGAYEQLVAVPHLAAEPGSAGVYYSLLARVSQAGQTQAAERLVAFMAAHQGLCNASASVPDALCPAGLRHLVAKTRTALS